MTNPNNKAAYPHCTPTDTANQPPPKSGLGFYRFVFDTIEELPEIQQMLDSITNRRRRARPGYSPRTMLRLFCLKFMLKEPYNNALLQRLEEAPRLRKLCDLDDEVPSESTVSRFFRYLTDHRRLIEDAIPSAVERMREHLPGLGDVVSIDGTDIEAYANPKRNPTIDETAEWGVRTPKNRVRQVNSPEYFFGYKMHLVADAIYDVPLSYRILPANKNESPQMPATVGKAQSAYEWLKPKYLVADRGYDSMANHKYLIEREITPIIHLRKPSRTKLHGGIYTAKGAPTCLGGREMTYVRTDPETGKHLYRCPAGGCERFKKKNIFVQCNDSHWEDPADNLRVIGVVARQSQEWKNLFNMRTGIERYFSSGKRSRLLNQHQYLGIEKIKTHVALSMLTYLATMYTHIMAGDSKRMRHMSIRI